MQATPSGSDDPDIAPDRTAVCVALWRALHVELDPPPHVLADTIGLALAAPGEDWRRRPEMGAERTRRSRAAIVARARCIEDLVEQQADRGVRQYVILGAGLDSFAERRPDLASRLTVFEVDRPGPLAWKQRRLAELGYAIPASLRFAAVDFEAGASWSARLATAGFNAHRPSVVAAAGVSMYLTGDAVAAMLREAAALAPGSTLAMTFMLPLDAIEPAERPRREVGERRARANGTPFISFFTPPEMLAFARACGFRDARNVLPVDLARRYFTGRSDGLRPGSSEALLVATT